ncbi:MAG: ABC transporter permease [Anaerolineaceae bacterium]|nr:ABC transporter permease [Anaerolineaceae bacterium]
MTQAQIISLINSAVVFGTVIIFGAVGEILTEKGGNLNLGVPGIMFMGGIAGLIGTFFYEKAMGDAAVPIVCVLIAVICALIASFLSGLLFAFMTVTLRCNQNIMGLAFNIFAAGFANFYGGSLNKLAGGVGQINVLVTSAAFRATIPALNGLGNIGKIFFSYGFLSYVAIALAVILRWFLNRTMVGLNLRAVGEDPSAADAVGIDVAKYKYLSTSIGAAISGLGGLYYVMDYTKGTWDSAGGIEGLGWLAVALVIFASWRPLRVIWGAYLFGILSWMYFYIPGLTRRSQEIFKMLPYIATLAVLIIVSLQHKVENQPPKHLGLPYFREER